MKIVLNKDFGGFGISKEAYDYMGVETEKLPSSYDLSGKPLTYFDIYYPIEREHEDYRYNSRLIEFIENNLGNPNGKYSNLEVVEIPDEFTDMEIDEYDGYETAIYVLNGKIYRA